MGEASESERLEARRQHLGFVFQSFHLLAALPVAENVALAQRLKRQPIDPGRVREILETLGIGIEGAEVPEAPQRRRAAARGHRPGPGRRARPDPGG